MHLFKKVILILFVFIGLIKCNTPEDNSVSKQTVVQDFIWKGLNQYYLWQENVLNLSDTRFRSQAELTQFLNGQTPTNLFNNLLYQKGTTDRFSYLFEDYNVLEEWLSGTAASDGMDYGLSRISDNSNNIFGWVRYILPQSDAEIKGVKRGMVFYAVNNTVLTTSNYSNLLALSSHTIQLADYDNGKITPNGKEISLTKTTFSENPIYLNKVIEVENKRIGYLVYNSFYSEFDTQLNNAFGSLKSQNITDLVLDLRYNSGGSIRSAQRLASMITGQFNGKVFSKQQWNKKVQQYIIENEDPSELEDRFVDKIDNTAINSLNLNTIYILTSSNSTASASELIINGLKSYINVVQIGGTTVGKNVGSITLYDAIDFSKEKSNPTHRYAMQPIVLKITNADGFGDYQQGLVPNITYNEDLGNLGTLGDTNEPLLQLAINKITGVTTPLARSKRTSEIIHIKTDFDQMYLNEIPKGVLNFYKK